jgi:large subunit ribosomal protein L9
MDVILLEKVQNLGSIGDRVKVRSGYGRNFLVPRGKATLATQSNVAIFEARRADLEKKEADELQAATQRAASAAKLTLSLTAKAGTEGKLFGPQGLHSGRRSHQAQRSAPARRSDPYAGTTLD